MFVELQGLHIRKGFFDVRYSLKIPFLCVIPVVYISEEVNMTK